MRSPKIERFVRLAAILRIPGEQKQITKPETWKRTNETRFGTHCNKEQK